ncbi:MAG: metal ABC transporter permease [Pseudomonadota bacterium]
MLDDFLVRAALAGVGTALATGALGCFVVWRRMAYFGDAMAHAALMGVALSLAFSFSITLGVVIAALAMAVLFLTLTGQGQTADATLGVLAHAGLALGLVGVALVPGQRISLDAYLFGDVLNVTRADLAVIWGGAVVVGGVLWWQWSALLTTTLSADLAHAAGIDPKRQDRLITFLLAIVVAVAIKVVGALLITALLIIPAATAQRFGRTPEIMAIVSSLLGAAAAIAGLQGALIWDTPVGPSIVVAAATFFGVSMVMPRSRA